MRKDDAIIVEQLAKSAIAGGFARMAVFQHELRVPFSGPVKADMPPLGGYSGALLLTGPDAPSNLSNPTVRQAAASHITMSLN